MKEYVIVVERGGSGRNRADRLKFKIMDTAYAWYSPVQDILWVDVACRNPFGVVAMIQNALEWYQAMKKTNTIPEDNVIERGDIKW